MPATSRIDGDPAGGDGARLLPCSRASDSSGRRHTILVFVLSGERYGLMLADVREVVRAVRLTPLPDAPILVEGIFDLRGELVPVLDLRRRLGLPAKEIEVSDHLIVAEVGSRTVALRADLADSLYEVEMHVWDGVGDPGSERELTAGLARLSDGLVVIHDLERFLSAPEAEALLGALALARSAAG